jgi:transcriptional regulator with XRE-family HTH domain
MPNTYTQIYIQIVFAVKAFGNQLQKLRLSKGMSQEDLADESGLAYTTINKLENGHLNTGIATLFDLAKGLKVPPRELFDF